MRCSNCEHQNPEENRYCGMCGSALAAKPSSEPTVHAVEEPIRVEKEHLVEDPIRVEKAPANFQWEPVTAPPSRTSAPLPERLETADEPADTAPATIAPAAEERPRTDKWWVDERETTVSGPSILGLNSLEPGNGGGYSYLFQDEPERSHKGRWVMLALLLMLGGAVYAKWQPIRDYVLTTGFTHARAQQPRAAQNTNHGSAPASAGPATTMATSDAQSPPAAPPSITTATDNNSAGSAAKPDQGANQADKSAGATKQPDQGRAAAGGNASGTPAGRSADAATRQPSAKPEPSRRVDASATEAKRDKAGTAANDEDPANTEKPSATSARKPRAAAANVATANEGSELVTSGEKYLYGRGAPRSCNQAVSYFNAAAAKQNPQAFSHLGALYATGECVPMDRVTAYTWFRRAYAKEPSNHYFEQNLTMLWREMSPDERQRATGKP